MGHDSLKTGLFFGLTSGIITTLGLLVGLESGTGSKPVVIGGIITIAVADSMSDALGIHISEESENVHTSREIWVTTFATFASKLLFALTFLVPVLLFDLGTAVIVSIIWGFSMLCALSYHLAKENGSDPLAVMGEHLVVATVVIVSTSLIGTMIAKSFS